MEKKTQQFSRIKREALALLLGSVFADPFPDFPSHPRIQFAAILKHTDFCQGNPMFLACSILHFVTARKAISLGPSGSFNQKLHSVEVQIYAGGEKNISNPSKLEETRKKLFLPPAQHPFLPDHPE